MKECAFCPHTAKLSAEHIVSDWINDLFPGKKKFSLKTAQGVDTEWTSNSLDWRAKVVCETCNNTWMSEIENNHAKPALTDLIIGNTDIAFTESRARSITFSAFKTGVILDHSQRDRQPFFSRRIRYAFREHLNIPANVNVWACPYIPRSRGDFHTCYQTGALSLEDHPSASYPLELYVFTGAIGHFLLPVRCREANRRRPLCP